MYFKSCLNLNSNSKFYDGLETSHIKSIYDRFVKASRRLICSIHNVIKNRYIYLFMIDF
jgi:hypothetical protein